MTIVSNANTRRELHKDHLAKYQQQENQAYELVNQLHNLYNNKDVKVNLFGETLNGLSTADLLTKVQQTADRNEGKALSIDDIVATVKEVVDKAIKNANKFGLKKLFSTISGKRYDDQDRVIIKGKNFKKIKL